MRNDYTEQDTERVRQEERSSAGLATNRLAAPALAPAGARNNNLAALALLVLGVMMLLGRVMPGRGEFMGGFVLLTIASCFLFFAFYKRIYGLLIPGCILAGLSAGVSFAAVTGGVSVLWGLALGFLAILFVGRALFNSHTNWPIYPAIPLFAVGMIVAVAQLPAIFVGGLAWLPLLLIAAGLYLGWSTRRAA